MSTTKNEPLTSTVRHGLSIGIQRVDEEFFVSMKAMGKLTHGDYEVITPMLDSALGAVKNPKVKVLIDGTEMRGWEVRAAWDDLKLGLRHGSKFDKVAIYGNKSWQQVLSKLGTWFISGEVKFFEDEGLALAWLKD